jgi:hypothetical protein
MAAGFHLPRAAEEQPEDPTVVDAIKERIDAIAAKLGRAVDRIKPHTPVPIETVEGFERTEGILVPAELRAFATTIGLGGSGPGGGLHSMEQWTSAFLDAESGLAALECRLDPSLRSDDYDNTCDPAQGTLAIASEGAGAPYTLIVVTGPHRDRLVRYHLETTACEWIERASPHGPATFLDWYEGWLAGVLAGSWPSFYGAGLIGSEADLRLALLDTSLPIRARQRAITSLSCIRTPAHESLAALQHVYESDETILRAAALPLLLSMVPHGLKIAESALQDPASEVRRAVIHGLRRMASPDAYRLLVRSLDDTDDENAEKALMALRNADGLDDAMLARLYARPVLRQQVVSILGRFSTNHSLTTLETALTDRSHHVRRIAAFSIGATGLQAGLPVLERARQMESEPSVVRAIDISLGRLKRSI